jgi:hypothetical protein
MARQISSRKKKSRVVFSDSDSDEEEEDFEEDLEDEEEEEDDDDDEIDEESFDNEFDKQQNEAEWKPCEKCKTLTLSESCQNPCPQPPLIVKISASKVVSHVKFFEAVCLRGGSAHLDASQWEQARKEAGLTIKHYREFYEEKFLATEKGQTDQLIKAALKGSGLKPPILVSKPSAEVESALGNANAKRKERCGVCEGCTKEDCGTCRFCKDKPKFGGKNSLKQACEKKGCTGAPIPLGATHVLSKTLPLEHPYDWQRSLLSAALWGSNQRMLPKNESYFCDFCSADVRLLSQKSECTVCKWAVTCETCHSAIQSFWCCQDCLRDDAPSLLTLGVCAGCAQTFTQTRVGQPCVDCAASYCSSCSTTDLQRDSPADGGGLRCFYCRVFSEKNSVIGIESRDVSTKKLRVVGLAV